MILVILLAIAAALIAFDAGASVAKVVLNPHVCDQKEYDSLYNDFVRVVLDNNDPKLEQPMINIKNKMVFRLRTLCRGQRSSYEVGL